jgi:hypothetical protein
MLMLEKTYFIEMNKKYCLYELPSADSLLKINIAKKFVVTGIADGSFACLRAKQSKQFKSIISDDYLFL